MTLTIIFLLLLAVIYLMSRIRFLHLAFSDDLRDLRAEVQRLHQQLQQLHSARSTTPTAVTQPVGKVNLNRASKTGLQKIPKVGAACAQKIIDARPLNSLAMLDAIEGLTDVQRENLRAHGELG